MRNIPTITKNLLIINILAFAASYVLKLSGIDLDSICGLHFFMAEDFHIFQLFTYMFLHGGFTHIFFNMFALWMFGCVIENVWGPRKFLFYYISCGVGAGLMQEIAQLLQFYILATEQIPGIGISELVTVARNSSTVLNAGTTIGASGAVYAILLAFGMTFPNERIFIFPLPVPIKAKWFVMIYVALELFMALNSSGDGVAHMAHLGGMLFGFLMIRYWNKAASAQGGLDKGRQFFERLKTNFDRHRGNQYGKANMHAQRGGRESDMEYNARKRANQEEVDRILDKIRKSGYDSLTAEEKKKLFEQSDND